MRYLSLPKGLRLPVWLKARDYSRPNRGWERFDLREICDDEVCRAIRSIPRHYGGFQWGEPADTVALVAATAKSVLGIKCPANQPEKILALDAGFDGTDSTKAPAIVNVCSCTWATNSPGTASTTVTPQPYDTGRPETLQLTGAKNWTTEPTVLTVMREFLIPTYMGSGLIPLPLTNPFIAKGGNGCVLRATTPTGSTPNFAGTIGGEE